LVPSSDDWQEFEGTSEARSLLGGAGNVDDNLLELPAGSYRAVSLRAFDSSSPGITPSSGRRERALSSDAGKTWEVNWVMEFTRQARPSRTDRDATRSIRQFPGFVIVRGRRQATIEGERVVRR
jgi:hypothetical protein